MRFTDRRHFLKLSAAALATPALPGIAFADWPKDKTIRAVVPFNAGSTIDIIDQQILASVAVEEVDTSRAKTNVHIQSSRRRYLTCVHD